jgi:hypothetical protein
MEPSITLSKGTPVTADSPEPLETVYVLTNPAMPGLVKIGFTTNEDAKKRIDGLYTTGVPFPYKIEFVCKVPSAVEVEKALHVAFGPNRVNPKREFFQIETEQAIAILKLLHEEETTEQVSKQAQEGEVDEQSLAAAEQYIKRRPNLNFEEMGIAVGSQLVCTQNDAIVTVVGQKKVKLGDEELSLSAATRQILQLDYPVAPGPYWTFNGKLLKEIYNETYTDIE